MTDYPREVGEPNALANEKRHVGVPKTIRGDVEHILDTGVVGGGQDLRPYRVVRGGAIRMTQ